MAYVMVAWLLMGAHIVNAATTITAGAINVNTFDDEFDTYSNDTCSLREAIEAVNIHNDFGGCLLNGTAPYTIALDAGTYTLTRTGTGEDANQTGDLDIHAPVRITRADAAYDTIIQAGPTLDSAVDRVFHILPTADVVFDGLTIRYGVPETGGNGGGIANFGAVTLETIVLTDNRALGAEPGQGGGGLYNGPNSVATLNHTVVTANQATTGLGNGGGILNGPNALLEINGGKIQENTAARAGGGIENNKGFVTLTNLYLNDNTTGINGGGLHISGMGTAYMSGGEAQNNVAGAEGGALWNSDTGSLTVEDALIAYNTASGNDADQGGGGLFSDGGTLNVRNTTITYNIADGTSGSGGGILATIGSSLYVAGSTITENSAHRAGGGIEINALNMSDIDLGPPSFDPNNAGNPINFGSAMMGYVTLEDVEIANNTTGTAPGNGGGLHITGPGNVTVSDATVTDNHAAAEGGGFWNSAVGSLTVIDSTFTGNRAAGDDADQGGGALFSDGGEITVIDSTLRSNRATGTAGSGGGILATIGSNLNVRGGIIAANDSSRAGGGIEMRASAEKITYADIDGVTLEGNSTGAAPGNGGALHITGPAQVTVTDATVTNNVATDEGGGFWNSAVGTLMVVDTQFISNTASGDDADQGGGALFNDGGIMRVANTTITHNVADGTSGSGGGILATVGSTLSVLNSQLVGNRANRAGGGIEVRGTADEIAVARLDHVDFIDNIIGDAPGNGGALHITGQAHVLINGGLAMGNRAAAEGGAFWNSAISTLTVQNVTLKKNRASGDDADQGGGALFNDGGTMTVFNAHIVNNVADGISGSGGGIIAVPGSILQVTGSQIISSTANRAGGAIELNGTVTDTVTATLQGLQLYNNMAGSAPGNGGALHITGVATATVNGGVVMGNMATAEGGGLWNSAIGTLMVDGTAIKANVASGNDADQGGGGLFNDGGTLTVREAIISGNLADGTSGSGGAILNNQGTLTVNESTLAGNQSNRAGGGVEDNAGVLARLHNVHLLHNSTGNAPGNGGGLHITGAGTVDVLNSTIAENRAASEGGGLWNSAVGTLLVSGTTLNKNMTTDSDDESGGGALFNDGGDLTVSNSTLTGNVASNRNGGGLLNAVGTSRVVNVTVYANHDSGLTNAGATIVISNSIIANNGTDCVGPISTNGTPNLDTDGTCQASITADPRLGDLANNGGQTATLALLDHSPALDAGDNAICAASPVNGFDQHGITRPQGELCDLGAYEANRNNNDDGNDDGNDGNDGDDDGNNDDDNDDDGSNNGNNGDDGDANDGNDDDGNDDDGGNNGEDNGDDNNDDNGCAVVPNNLISNGGFAAGRTGWRFFTDSRGTFDITEQAMECLKAARVQIDKAGSNVQLYQRNLQLTANTRYRLTFAAYSSTGNDMSVYIHNHRFPYENYNLGIHQVNLSTEWQRFTVEFTSNNFSGTVDNGRLRFWLAPFAQDGDMYYIDDVRLEKVDSSESALADAGGQSVAFASGGMLMGMDEAAFDANVIDTFPNGNVVDGDSTMMALFLPLITR